jgi:hypothetical protein
MCVSLLVLEGIERSIFAMMIAIQVRSGMRKAALPAAMVVTVSGNRVSCGGMNVNR